MQESKMDFVWRVKRETKPTSGELFGLMCERTGQKSKQVVSAVQALSVSANDTRNAAQSLSDAVRRMNGGSAGE